MIYTTKILSAKNDSASSVSEAALLLSKGEIIAFPTETVYGLGADIFDETACKKVFEAKGRPAGNPLSAHCADVGQAGMVADISGTGFRAVAEKLLPGPVAVILPKLSVVPAIVTGGLDTISIRIPANVTSLALFKAFGRPVAGTSANISGKPSPVTAAEVLDDLSGKIPAVLEDDEVKFGIESTIISLVGPPAILRPGVISKEEIEDTLGEKVLAAAGKVPMAGIQRYKPAARVEIMPDEHDAAEFLARQPDLRALVLSRFPGRMASAVLDARGNIESAELLPETLYSSFRHADKEHMDIIIIIMDELSSRNEALLHRINCAVKLK